MIADADLAAAAGPAGTVGDQYGLPTVHVPAADWVAAAAALRDRSGTGCGFFDWLSAYDAEGSFVVAAHVYSVTQRSAVLLRTRLPGADPVLDSVTPIWAGADWHERETAEMFGITFRGHPRPAPLLLPPGFAGHPLRKDFPLAARARGWPGAVDPGPAAPPRAAGRPAGRRRVQPPGVPPWAEPR